MASIPETGLFWHMHHDVLMQYCTGYTKRVATIWATEDLGSRGTACRARTHLRLFRPVLGDLPTELAEAVTALTFLQAECDKDRAAWEVRARHAVPVPDGEFDKAHQEVHIASAAWQDGWHAYTHKFYWFLEKMELDTVRERLRPLVDALHQEQCHDCPWNGWTIFPSPTT